MKTSKYLALKHAWNYEILSMKIDSETVKERLMAKARLVLKHYIRKSGGRVPQHKRYDIDYLRLFVKSEVN